MPRARIRLFFSGVGASNLPPPSSLAAARQLPRTESVRASTERPVVRKMLAHEPWWQRNNEEQRRPQDNESATAGATMSTNSHLETPPISSREEKPRPSTGDERQETKHKTWDGLNEVQLRPFMPSDQELFESTTRKRPVLQRIPIFKDVNSMRLWRHQAVSKAQVVGLVPTMGALHSGHLGLVRQAAKECDHVLVSIYVNPAQFGANEDLASYPQTLTEDLAQLRNLNWEIESSTDYRGKVSAIFQPTTQEMYPFGLDLGSYLNMNPAVTQVLEGKSRPIFFQGVTTVVMKLLNVIQPDRAYFGQKDIQQLVVVQRMVKEFHIPTILRRGPTKREADGLALSSRNVYLGERRRKVANVLPTLLHSAFGRFNKAGQVTRKEILGVAFDEAARLQAEQRDLPPSQRARFEIDYLSLADPLSLEEVDVLKKSTGAILSGAMIMLPLEDIQPGEKLGLGGDLRPVRLIDNFLMGNASKYLAGIPRLGPTAKLLHAKT